MRLLRAPYSLVGQLTAWYSILSFVSVCLATVYLYWSVQRTLAFEAERTLSDRLETIRLLCLEPPFDLGRLRSRIEREWPITQAERFYAQISLPDGEILTQTPGIPEAARDALARLPEQAVARSPRKFDLTDEYRGITERLTASPWPTQPLAVKIVLNYAAEHKLLRDYRAKLAWTLLIALMICSLLGRRIAQRGVAPIRAISQVAAQITSVNLHARINAEGYPVEMAALTRTINAMLDRLEGSFTRLAQFSADIAHELKTPISNIVGETQVTLSKARTSTEYIDMLGSNLEECTHMSRIINSLLFLAQCDNPQLQLKKEPVRLVQELRNLIEFYEAAAADQQLQLVLTADNDATIHVERTLLQRSVSNLISNAIKQTPAGGRVEVCLTVRHDVAEIQVRDTGCGIAPEHLAFIWDRFYRVDTSRSKDSGGVGLGLALVKSIASIHGGTVHIESQVNVGTAVAIRLPIANVLKPVKDPGHKSSVGRQRQ